MYASGVLDSLGWTRVPSCAAAGCGVAWKTVSAEFGAGEGYASEKGCGSMEN
jgi:hypothetical protein